ncbi:MlaA family lipoprotein [Pseudomonas sp. TTU2014-080ASC]|uniref:MlaA family lipoprotein n=1 Tax=Pseudomonas sp. TTU2014-080ASC TaxID=1729724 RepID=UPI0007183EC2|nr:VacJ family lipoprotein [Pseudomonas sp. TTU2014-080ASC]KRW60027.1 ABC transporter [Pseudomonas sp. TTU2014-080ASC]
MLTGTLVHAQPAADADGFKNPLQQLQFNPGLDQREFERSTLNALNVYDPLESWNRRVYHFNYRFDEWVFLPVVEGYRYITPDLLETGVSNFFRNLGEVPTLVNSVLQLKPQRSMETTARLMINTLLGIGGIWDPATKMGLHRNAEDFGQTLGYYGVPAGPYLILPLLGPSSVRDAAGLAADYGTKHYVNWLNVAETSSNHPEITLLEIVDQRSTVNFRYGQLNSPFEYEKVRFVYSEARKLQVAD